MDRPRDPHELGDWLDHNLPPRVYYQDYKSAYVMASPPRQIRESLERSRRVGYDFQFAWRVALRKLMMPHENSDRRQWEALLKDPQYIAIWESAYLRQPHRGIDASAVMRKSLAPDDSSIAAHRHNRHAA